MKINKHQIKAVTKLSSDDRYRHAISSMVDWEEVWILRDKEKIYNISDSNILYIWPAKDYADIYSNELELDLKSDMIELDVFIDKILPELGDKISINIFSTPKNNGKIVSKKSFYNDINEECEKY